MSSTTNTMLDAALAYAKRGWRVLPVHNAPGGVCSCGKATCDKPGKHPRWHATALTNGVKSASSNPAIIQVWWQLWPDANIAVATGAGSGIWALDVDPDDGGDVTLAALMLQHGALPDTPTDHTGGGGEHRIWRHPGVPIGNRVRFAPGLDTRGDGGYIVVAPSVHASGQPYAWMLDPDDTPLADAPQWLLDLLQAPKAQPAQATTNGHAALPKDVLNYVVFGAQLHSRNDTLYHAAQQFYAAGYTRAEADSQLMPRARADGLTDDEIGKTITSAYQSTRVTQPAAAPGTPAGAASPSTPPPARPAGQTHSAMIAAALKALGYTFRMNLCGGVIEVNGTPITEEIAARIRTDARDTGLKPLGAVQDTYIVEAANNAYHPIRDYLNGLAWDGGRHIEQLAAALTCTDPDVIYDDGTHCSLIYVYLWRWLIGAVAKVFDGAQNMMLVLDGPQDIGKSHLAHWLCSSIEAYFIEAPINTNDKDNDVRLMSKFIWEVSELDATTRRADVAALKAFITKGVVTVRRAYDRHDTVKPAMASLIGTVNDSTGFLSDETGNRRFLVTTITGIDWSYPHRIAVDQIWAEAVAAYRLGEPWKLQPVEAARQREQNKLHETESILEGWIGSYFDVSHLAVNTRMTASEIIDHLRVHHDIRLSGSERAQAMELSRVLARLGVRKIRGHGYRGYEGIAPR